MATTGGKIDPDAYERSAKAAKKLLETQKSITKASQSFQDNFTSIVSLFSEVSGSQFFKQVPKTTEDIQAQILQWEQLQTQIEKAGQSINDSLTQEYKNFGKSFKKEISAIDSTSLSVVERMKKSMGSVFKDVDDSKLKEIYDAASLATGSFEKIGELLEKHKITTGENEDLVNKIQKTYDNMQKQDELRDVAIENIVKKHKTLSNIVDDELRAKTIIALKNKELPALLAKVSKIEREQILKGLHLQNNELEQQMRSYGELVDESNEVKKNMQDTTKTVFSLIKGLMAIGDNMKKKFIDRLFEFDAVLHDVQKNTGINMVDNAAKMTDLTTKAAQYNMSIEETGEAMSRMNEELRTTDFDLIADSVKDFAAIRKATGASTENLSMISGEMMRAGLHSKDFREAMEGANVASKQFGVSSKRVIESLSKNIEKMRQFGFTGGIESLTKMTAMAERLKTNVDEIFNVAKRARTIEGAMDMAAELQLAGGSFANINPMDLLASARNSPEALQKILYQMGSDIGRFNEDKGAIEFDAVDKDRLEIVAEATGQSFDEIQKRIQAIKLENQKLSIFPEEMFNIDGLDADAVRAQISDAMEFDTEKGEWVIKGDNMFGAKSIADLQNLTDEQIKAAVRDQEIKAADLEKQAEENQSLKDSFKAFTDKLLNMLTVFQPVLEALGSAIQWLTDSGFGKILLYVGGSAFALSKVIPMFLAGSKKFLTSMNFKNWKGIFQAGGVNNLIAQKNAAALGSPSGGAGDKLGDDIKGLSDKTKKVKAGTGLKEFMQNLAAGLKSFGGKSATKIINGAAVFSLAIIMVGGALALIAAAFGAMGGDPLILLSMAAAIVGLAFAFNIMSKAAKGIQMGSVIKMSVAMLIMGAALIPFSIAALIMSDVDWTKVLVGVVLLTAVIFGLMALGMAMTGPQLLFLAVGIAILISVAAGLLMFGGAMLMLATAMEKLQGVDVSNIGKIAMAMMDLVPAMMGLALAGLMFANPIILLGFALMLLSLLSLAAVLVPLSAAMEMGADALDKMASGVTRLSDALSKLDMAKMKELAEISQNMADASDSSKMADAMAKFAAALKGGGGAGAPTATGGTKKIVVQLTLPNGRVLKEQEIKDIEIVS